MNNELARWRAETRGCETRVHLNNAGAALMPNPVLAAVVAHLRLESETGGYEAAEEEIDRIKAAYDAVGAIIGSPTRNVGIVENATVAVAQALSAYDLRPDDVIVTSRADYPSNQLMYLSLARRLGVRLLRAADLPHRRPHQLPETRRVADAHPAKRPIRISSK